MKERIKARMDARLRQDKRPNLSVQDYWKGRLAIQYRILGVHRPKLRDAEVERFGGLVMVALEAMQDEYEERISALEDRLDVLETPPAVDDAPVKRRPGRPPRAAADA